MFILCLSCLSDWSLMVIKIESIRSFNPVTQLSEKSALCYHHSKHSNRNEAECNRVVFKFLPENTFNLDTRSSYSLNYLDDNLTVLKINLLENDEDEKGDDPKIVYDSIEDIKSVLSTFKQVEFGLKSFYENAVGIKFNVQPQTTVQSKTLICWQVI